VGGRVREGRNYLSSRFIFFSVSDLVYLSILKMEEICASEALFFDLYGFTA
jgi:hypothetical protein